MFEKPRRGDVPNLTADEGVLEFHRADVLYALEWSAIAPGLGGWDVRVDDEAHPRLVAVAPPGSERACFFLFRKEKEVSVVWRSHSKQHIMTAGSYPNLRKAVVALCTLHDDLMQELNESMEILYPRTLRNQKQTQS